MKTYNTVLAGGQAEITEKKSRFIANIFPVSTEEEAFERLEEIRKKYWDARHNCWAYVLGGNPASERMSDDGEPAGTAGKPILEVIRGRGLTDVLIVVTRYFGGTLLGTGGLVRAYTSAAAEGIEHSKIITRIFGSKLHIVVDYADWGRIQYTLGKRGISPEECSYTDKVELDLLVPEDEVEGLKKEVMEGTIGEALIEKVEECWFEKK